MTTSAPTTQPTTLPGGETRTQLEARVIEVTGSVEYALGDADPLDLEKWKPVKVDMMFGAGTQLRTGFRSRCILMFGNKPNETVISIRRATSAKILDFYRTQTEQRVRVGLGYGAIRGGSTEGTLRSDVIIDSTVATLAKRGTEGFEIEIEPVTGYYRLSLARSGLVDAFASDPVVQRELTPGQYLSSDMVASLWVTQAMFDRTARLFEVQAASHEDIVFMTNHTTGFSSLAPGTGGEAPSLAGRGSDQSQLQGSDSSSRDAVEMATMMGLNTLLISRSPTPRPEGDFGFRPTFRLMAPRAGLTGRRISRPSAATPRSTIRSRISR